MCTRYTPNALQVTSSLLLLDDFLMLDEDGRERGDGPGVEGRNLPPAAGDLLVPAGEEVAPDRRLPTAVEQSQRLQVGLHEVRVRGHRVPVPGLGQKPHRELRRFDLEGAVR